MIPFIRVSERYFYNHKHTPVPFGPGSFYAINEVNMDLLNIWIMLKLVTTGIAVIFTIGILIAYYKKHH